MLPRALCQVQDGTFTDAVYPGRRLVELAKDLGAQAVLGSLCGDDYRGALERTAAKIAPLLQ